MSEPVEGTVEKVSMRDGEPSGLKLKSEPGWRNFSKPEYRKEPYEIPLVGDSVRFWPSDSNEKFIQTIEVIERPQETAERAAPDAYQVNKEANIARSVALKAAVDFVVGMSGGFAPGPTFDEALSTVGNAYNEFLGLLSE